MRRVWHYFGVVRRGAGSVDEIVLNEHAMSAAGIGGEAQDLGDHLVTRLGPGGLAHMHGAAVTSLQRGCHALLRGERLPTGVVAALLELQAQRVHEVVSQHADEQMPFDPPVDLVEHRAQGKRSANPIFPAIPEAANLVSTAMTKGMKWIWIGNGWSDAWSRRWLTGRLA